MPLSKLGEQHKQFRCTHPGCDKVFNRRDYLERHATNHLSVKPFICYQCNRHFSRKDLYDNHLTTKRHARVVGLVVRDNEAQQQHRQPPRGLSSSEIRDPSKVPYQPEAAGHAGAVSADGQPHQYLYLDGGEYDQRGLPLYAPQQDVPYPPLQGESVEAGTGSANYNGHTIAASGIASASGLTAGLTTGAGPWAVPPLLSHAGYATSHYDYRGSHNGLTPDLTSVYTPIDSSIPSMRQTPTGSVFNEQPSGSFDWVSDPSLKKGLTGKVTTEGLRIGGTTESEGPGRFSNFAVSFPSGETSAESRSESTEEFGDDSRGSGDESLKDLGAKVVQSIRNENWRVADAFLLESSDEEEPVAVQESGRSPSSIVEALGNAVGDKRYGWFFDDAFESEKAKYGYDRYYTELGKIYQDRADVFRRSHQQDVERDASQDARLKKIDHKTVSVLFSIARDLPSDLRDPVVVENLIGAATREIDVLGYFIHQPSLDLKAAHPALVSVLVLMGLSISDDPRLRRYASSSWANVFLYAYEALLGVSSNTRFDMSTLQSFQAICLLLRYERLFQDGDESIMTYHEYSPSSSLQMFFLRKIVPLVPHIDEFAAQTRNQPIWATVMHEGYMFHQGAESYAQWREWIVFESFKRVAHYAFYCHKMRLLAEPRERQVSIFTMNIHMLCPDALWRASSADEFFVIVGPSGIVTSIPYLGLIKSLVRFPRIAQGEEPTRTDTLDVRSDHASVAEKAKWSLFALKTVSYGLGGILSKISGLISNGDEMLHAMMRSQGPKTQGGTGMSIYDRTLQARLYRGLDVWYHHFVAYRGYSMEGVLNLPVSATIALLQEVATPQDIFANDQPETSVLGVLYTLRHFSSFLYVHQDLQIVLQVDSNLKRWLKDSQGQKTLDQLLDYLYMPLYTKWTRTGEAQALIGNSILNLAWWHAIAGQVPGGDDIFLYVMYYMSLLSVWLYDVALNDSRRAAGQLVQDIAPLRLEGCRFIHDGAEYLRELHGSLSDQSRVPTKRATKSALLMGICSLYGRKGVKPLAHMLMELLLVMAPEHTSEELWGAVAEARQFNSVRIEQALVNRREKLQTKVTLDAMALSGKNSSTDVGAVSGSEKSSVSSAASFSSIASSTIPVKRTSTSSTSEPMPSSADFELPSQSLHDGVDSGAESDAVVVSDSGIDADDELRT